MRHLHELRALEVRIVVEATDVSADINRSAARRADDKWLDQYWTTGVGYESALRDGLSERAGQSGGGKKAGQAASTWPCRSNACARATARSTEAAK